jgi:hypothetical protein
MEEDIRQTIIDMQTKRDAGEMTTEEYTAQVDLFFNNLSNLSLEEEITDLETFKANVLSGV